MDMRNWMSWISRHPVVTVTRADNLPADQMDWRLWGRGWCRPPSRTDDTHAWRLAPDSFLSGKGASSSPEPPIHLVSGKIVGTWQLKRPGSPGDEDGKRTGPRLHQGKHLTHLWTSAENVAGLVFGRYKASDVYEAWTNSIESLHHHL